MKILVNEGVPQAVGEAIGSHHVVASQNIGWLSGDAIGLIEIAEHAGFDVVLVDSKAEESVERTFAASSLSVQVLFIDCESAESQERQQLAGELVARFVHRLHEDRQGTASPVRDSTGGWLACRWIDARAPSVGDAVPFRLGPEPTAHHPENAAVRDTRMRPQHEGAVIVDLLDPGLPDLGRVVKTGFSSRASAWRFAVACQRAVLLSRTDLAQHQLPKLGANHRGSLEAELQLRHEM